MAISPEFAEAFFAWKQDWKTFKERKAHFLASMATTPDKLGDRVLAGLLAEEEALQARQRALKREFTVELDFDLDDEKGNGESV